jgi:chemotaxis protein MotB
VMDPSAPSDSPSPTVVEIEQASRTAAQRFDRETQKLEKIVKTMNLGNDVQVSRNERGILVRLAGDALFDSGRWDLKPGIVGKITRLEAELEAFGHPIEIAGHTDGAPYPGSTWGNYELGFKRALSVHALFLKLGYPPKRMRSTTHGADDPIVEPKRPTESVPRNRRIEITILEPGAEDTLANLTDKEREVAARGGVTRGPTTPAGRVDQALEAEFGIIQELAGTSKAATR